MKIDYTEDDAYRIEAAFHALPTARRKEGRAIRAAYLRALNLCGVKYVEYLNMSALRVYAPDGNDFKKG